MGAMCSPQSKSGRFCCCRSLYRGYKLFWSFTIHLQSIYNFFSASPKRWSILTGNLENKAYVVQSVSDTRWSARSDAMRALFKNYSEIKQSLIIIAEHPAQTPSAIQEAKSLAKKLDTFETALMCTIWNVLLQNLNMVNKATQEPGIELGTVVRLYDSLLTYLSEIRTQFNSFELKAKELSECDYKKTLKRMRKFFLMKILSMPQPTQSQICVRATDFEHRRFIL